MIVVDPLFDTTPFTTAKTPACFRNTFASHMMSTLPGEEGKLELLEFAGRLGLRPEWIQYPGTRRQHFDLTAPKRAQALRLGAQEVSAAWLPPVQPGEPTSEAGAPSGMRFPVAAASSSSGWVIATYTAEERPLSETYGIGVSEKVPDRGRHARTRIYRVWPAGDMEGVPALRKTELGPGYALKGRVLGAFLDGLGDRRLQVWEDQALIAEGTATEILVRAGQEGL